MKIRKLLSAVLVLALLAGMVPGALMEEVQSAAVEEYAGEAEAFDIAEAAPEEEELPVEEALSADEEVPAEAVEAASEEVALELSGDFIEVKAGEQAPAARTLEETISGNAKLEMTTLDTLRIAVSGAEAVQSWTTGTRKVVPVVSVEDGVAVVKAIAAGKATLKAKVLVGGKSKSYTVTLTVTDPLIPEAVLFTDSMPASLPVGSTLDLRGCVAVKPGYANADVTFKVSGAGKLGKDGVTLTGSKAGKATITATSKSNKKAKATFKLDVLANKVDKLNAKPAKTDAAQVSGGWTLWPLSAEVLSKGGIACQFYILNGTDEAIKTLENVDISLAVGSRYSTIASLHLNSVKASAAKGGSGMVKITFPAIACEDLTGVFLPAHQAAGTLYFDINADEVTARSAKNSYAFIPTQFPVAVDENSPERVLQSLLASLKLISHASVTGEIDEVTKDAVKFFQDWAAENGYPNIPRTGEADEATLAALKACVGKGVNLREAFMDRIQESLDVLADEEVTLDDIYLETSETVSDAGITDPEQKALIQKINETTEALNASIEEYNDAVDDLLDGFGDLADSLSTGQLSREGDMVVFCYGALKLAMDNSLYEALGPNSVFTDGTVSKDGEMVTLELNGKKYYVTSVGDTLYLTGNKAKSKAHRSDAESFYIVAKGASDSGLENFMNAVAKLDNLWTGIGIKVGSLQEKTDTEIQMQREIRNYYRKLADKDPYWHPRLYKENATLDRMLNKASTLSKISTGLSVLNVPGQILSARSLITNWKHVNQIAGHGHPTVNDAYPEGYKVCEDLRQEILAIRILYTTTAVTSVLGMVSTCVAIITGLTSLAVPAAAFITGGSVLALIGAAAGAIYLDQLGSESYDKIIKLDGRLHSRVVGKVEDKDTLEPLQYVSVTSDGATAFTDENGRYELYVQPGSRKITFSRDKFETFSSRVNVDGETALDVQLRSLENGMVIGIVKDSATGMGLEGVTVSVGASLSTTTDADGTYTLARVPVGRQEVTFSMDRYAAQTKAVTVEGAKAARVDAALKCPYGSVSGLVKDKATGKGLEGVSVSVEGGPSTTTGADGSYRLQDVTEGKVSLSFSKQDYGRVTKSVTVKAGKDAALNAELSSAYGVITGKVTVKGAKTGISGVTVTSDQGHSVTTGSDGSYTLQKVPEGTVKVTFAKEGCDGAVKSVTVKAGKSVTLNAELSSDNGAITGVVTDMTTKKPVPGVTVHTEDGEFTTTDSEGRYRFEHVYMGDVWVYFIKEGYGTRAAQAAVRPDKTVTLNMEMPQASAIITGRVTDKRTGEPLEGVSVWCDDGNLVLGTDVLSTVTGSDGNYQITGAVEGMELAVRFYRKDYGEMFKYIVVKGGKTYTLDAELTNEPATISGKVTDGKSGKALSGVTVVLWADISSSEDVVTTTNSQGEYRFENVKPGMVNMFFFRNDLGMEWFSAVVVSGQNPGLNAKITSGTGTLTFHAGWPGVEVTIPGAGTKVTDEKGEVTFENVKTGLVEVSFFKATATYGGETVHLMSAPFTIQGLLGNEDVYEIFVGINPGKYSASAVRPFELLGYNIQWPQDVPLFYKKQAVSR